jgi:hypothetical protein
VAARPKVPTVVSAEGVPSTRERVSATRLTVTAAHLTNGGQHVDPASLARIINQLQDNNNASTLAARSHPLALPYLAEGVKMNTSGGTVGAVTANGTSPPTLTLNGSPLGSFQFVLTIPTGGALGTATFSWSSDGGKTLAGNNVLIPQDASGNPAPVTLGSTGVTAQWTTTGPWTVDNVYTATATMTPVVIRHGLGEPAVRFESTGSNATSHPFAATKVDPGSADWPTSKYPPSQYLLLYPGCTGTYDLAVYGA